MCITAHNAWRGFRCESGANLRTFSRRYSAGVGRRPNYDESCNAPCDRVIIVKQLLRARANTDPSARSETR